MSNAFFQFTLDTEMVDSVFIKETNEQGFRITDKGRIIRDFLSALEPNTTIQEAVEKEYAETLENQESDSEDDYGNFDNPQAHEYYYEAKIWALKFVLDLFKAEKIQEEDIKEETENPNI